MIHKICQFIFTLKVISSFTFLLIILWFLPFLLIIQCLTQMICLSTKACPYHGIWGVLLVDLLIWFADCLRSEDWYRTVWGILFVVKPIYSCESWIWRGCSDNVTISLIVIVCMNECVSVCVCEWVCVRVYERETVCVYFICSHVDTKFHRWKNGIILCNIYIPYVINVHQLTNSDPTRISFTYLNLD